MNVNLHSIAELLHRVGKEKTSSDLKKKKKTLFHFPFLLPCDWFFFIIMFLAQTMLLETVTVFQHLQANINISTSVSIEQNISAGTIQSSCIQITQQRYINLKIKSIMMFLSSDTCNTLGLILGGNCNVKIHICTIPEDSECSSTSGRDSTQTSLPRLLPSIDSQP